MPNKVYLSLGSNVGDREANLQAAMVSLGDAGVTVGRVSSIYETEPVDFLEQPWFLNCVVEGETELEPLALLGALQEIQSRMGSTKPVPKGPRLIDIDILLYGNQTIATPELQVPHPRMTQRRFVLVPLAELAQQLSHRAWSGNVSDLLAHTEDQSQVRKKEEPLQVPAANKPKKRQ